MACRPPCLGTDGSCRRSAPCEASGWVGPRGAAAGAPGDARNAYWPGLQPDTAAMARKGQGAA